MRKLIIRNSSCISSMSYNTRYKRLRLTMTGTNQVYDYSPVAPETVLTLRTAKSVGRAYNDLIKYSARKYDCVRVR